SGDTTRSTPASEPPFPHRSPRRFAVGSAASSLSLHVRPRLPLRLPLRNDGAEGIGDAGEAVKGLIQHALHLHGKYLRLRFVAFGPLHDVDLAEAVPPPRQRAFPPSQAKRGIFHQPL